MNVDKFNYDVIGRNILIDIGPSEMKGGIIAPDQAKDEVRLDSEEALRIVCISEQGMEALDITSTQVEKGYYIYLAPRSMPVLRFNKNGRKYALIEVHEIAGFAPNGFDRDLWLAEKEIERQAEKDRIDKLRRASLGGSTGKS